MTEGMTANSYRIIPVVLGIIRNRNGLYLISQRTKNQKLPDLWEFPGGKLEKNETPEEALLRELWEELRIEVIIIGFHSRDIHHFKHGSFEVSYYNCLIEDDQQPQAIECAQFRFVLPKDLWSYDFAPGDIELATRLSKESQTEFIQKCEPGYTPLSETAKRIFCKHEHLDMDGICHNCGSDRRGI